MNPSSPDGHYFSPEPSVASDPRVVDVLLDGVDLQLQSDAGVFSHGQLDEATRIFLDGVPSPPAHGNLLDLGCGYGPIALTLATWSPGARVYAIDVNERACDLTRDNARRAKLDNVHVSTPQQTPADVVFDAIYSNPPIRIGKQALHELLATWLQRLAPTGVCYLVVGKHLGADSIAKWLTSQGLRVDRLSSKQSYRVLEVRRTDREQI
ncbi:methyltransferase family protein [Antricoccus suffuscus]|uniref:Methyltransferase family protein n=1 Tax=Antricoccus suffuscus TaxID=1629062 RepID=A0A2T0ZZX1_9ACTN|nr:methyltransferase [Antricoccus suffuscus]PRZ41903.1 methyltransferase family protein [Antricoccus suffuscus]